MVATEHSLLIKIHSYLLLNLGKCHHYGYSSTINIGTIELIELTCFALFVFVIIEIVRLFFFVR